MEEKRLFIQNSFDNPPVVDPLIISCVGKIADAYSKHRWRIGIEESQVKIVLESLAMYRQLIDVGQKVK